MRCLSVYRLPEVAKTGIAVTIDTERHGPYAAVIRNKYRHTAISRTATTVTISNIQFWDALLGWFDLNVDDFNRYLHDTSFRRISGSSVSTAGGIGCSGSTGTPQLLWHHWIFGLRSS